MQTTGLSNPFSDPLVVFAVQLLLSGATIIISILVARRWGEMAATKYTLTKTERSSHHHTLVGEPWKGFRETLASSKVSQILVVSALFSPPEPEAQMINLNENKLPEVDLLLSHLKEGYPELHSRILKYQDAFNGISSQVLQTYQKSIRELREKWGRLPIEHDWRVEGGYPGLAQAISVVVYRRLALGQQFAGAVFQPPRRITIGDRPSAEVPSPTDAAMVLNDLNSALDENGQMWSMLQQLWERAKPLEAECEYFNVELERIRGWVQSAGISLKGWCPAGREAGYE